MGVTRTLPVNLPTLPIPGVILKDDAFATSQLKVEEPPIIMVFGIAVNRLIMGGVVKRVVGGLGDEELGLVVRDEPDEGEFDIVVPEGIID
ncbi:MAG: hypothetical protein ABSG90_03330 [Dehalococcoidia bacterium]